MFTLSNLRKVDEWYTPEYAVFPILKYIHPKSRIWCPFDKDTSSFVKVFSKLGHDVVYGHIETGQDFFKQAVPDNIDYVISNPPYSRNTDVLKHLFQIGIPFALLVNIFTIFDSKERFELFRGRDDFEVLYLYPRVNFISAIERKENRVMWQSAYICHNMLDKRMDFSLVNRNATCDDGIEQFFE